MGVLCASQKSISLSVCVTACGVFANCEVDADCKLTICRYLVAVNVCVFVYSTLQFVQLAYTVILGISFIPSILISTWLTFGCDQVGSFFLSFAKSGEETGCSFRLFWVFRSRSKCVNPAELGSSWTMHYYIMERCNNIQHNICSLHFSILWRLYLYQNHNGLRSVPLTKGSVHLTSKQTIRHVSFDHWNGWINLDMEFSSNFSCNLSNNNQEGVWCEEHLLSWSIITVMSNCLSEG